MKTICKVGNHEAEINEVYGVSREEGEMVTCCKGCLKGLDPEVAKEVCETVEDVKELIAMHIEENEEKEKEPFIKVSYNEEEGYIVNYPINKKGRCNEITLSDDIIDVAGVTDIPDIERVQEYLNSEDGVRFLSVIVGRKIKVIERV